ncbi:G2/M phase-specific E3 ubiquitin-protein ligase-like [Onychostoma macrolepis]|uniref:G2/M phase-specific E3 ubiquitin-protein ligase-like n=1 Tax=Onychostoma macrolepis TaxID=369639 RepID=UPI00272B45F6|nr:G2/M phase-specific E3 ubiquitin-protein ligase-like [Onychostoma macrolepis]
MMQVDNTTASVLTGSGSHTAHTAASAPTGNCSHTAHTNTIPTDEFYIESSGSDIEVLLASPVRRYNPILDRELPAILKEFREDNLDFYSNIIVIARRKNILKSACVTLSRGCFEWHKTPNIEFVGEMGEDYGGPRREFFRLLMIELQSNLGIFEGKPGQLLFSYNQKALDENKLYTAGRLMAWSIIHNRPSMKCINIELFMLMCGQKPDLSTFDRTNFLENDLVEKLAMVVRCNTAEELTELKNSLGDWICDCGVPNIFTASVSDLPTIYGQLVTHYIYHRFASMIQQFTSGLNSCGRLWEVVLNNWTAFHPLFTNTRGTLTRNEVRDLFSIVWSSPGSSRRDLEEDTVFQWECWLMLIQEEDVGISFEDVLVFVTAADSIPPLGFQQNCQVEFYDQEEPTRRIPYASTCALTLYLPRGVSEEEDFRELMFLAIKGSLRFGKV